MSSGTDPALRTAEEEYFGPRFLARVHGKLHRNPVTSVITKAVVTLVGVLVMCAGLIMMVTPGPGIVGLVLGLAILSTEWRWADRWLDAARAAAHKAAEKARAMDPAVRRRRILVAATVVVVTVGVIAGLVALFGWPDAALTGWEWLQGLAPVLPELPGAGSS